MARILRMNGALLSSQLILVSGNVLPIKVSGLGPNRKHLQIKSSSDAVKVAVVAANDSNIEQRLTLQAQSVTSRKVALLAAFAQSGPEDASTERIEVIIEPAIELPVLNSEEGIVARMLLVENLTPGDSVYASMQVLLTMQAMRWVFVNRKAFGTQYFGAPPNASITGLIKAPNQVDGFESYPNIGAQLSNLLTSIMKIANDASDTRFVAYRQYVQNALDVAQGRKIGADPCPTGLFAWRTAGSAGPGDNYVGFHCLGGQDFYTLTAEFRKDPLMRNRNKP